ncbi:MAG TPA: hypothetical protein VMI52_03595 [Acetobacteraceae bacterium]|nr:hypothetical protein [Acetobacteraceae bacterium]
MHIVRNEEGEATLIAADGRELLAISALLASDEEFDTLLRQIESITGGNSVPRIVVNYKEGLFDTAQADIACEVILIEEDPFDEPPTAICRKSVTEGDPAGVAARIGLAEQRQKRLAGQ